MMFDASCRVLSILACMSLLVCLMSCDEQDHIASPFVEEQGGTPDTELGAISGLAVNASGAALAGVRLDVFSSQGGDGPPGFADISGRFFLANLALDSEVVKFSHSPQLYTSTYRRLRLSPGGELHFPRVLLLPVTRGSIFYASQGGSAAVGALGSEAVFPQFSFITPDSTLYSERVAPYLADATVRDDDFAAAFPGEFLGRRLDGSEVILKAMGAMWVFVSSQAGPLDLAPDVGVVYRLGVDLGSGHSYPSSVPIWLLDTLTGYWNEVGEALLVDDVYETTATSLGPICWALPADGTCVVSGVVQDNSGEPLRNASVDYRDPSGRFRTSTLTHEDGSFALEVIPGAGGVVTPYLGSIAGRRDTVNTLEACPYVIAEPLVLTLPSFRIDLNWPDPDGDLDAHGRIFLQENDNLRLQWVINYIDRGNLLTAPYVHHEGDARGAGPETIAGRRWYDGRIEYWVHDYASRSSEALRASGAVVDVLINDQNWSFAVIDAPYEPAVSDTTGWWHVFDISIDGPVQEVVPRQRFAPAPRLRP